MNYTKPIIEIIDTQTESYCAESSSSVQKFFGYANNIGTGKDDLDD